MDGTRTWWREVKFASIPTLSGNNVDVQRFELPNYLTPGNERIIRYKSSENMELLMP